MPKIPLTGGFSIAPEGTHVFKITNTVYKPDFGKLEITLETANKEKHLERFSFKNKDGSENSGAINAFSYFAKTVLNNFELEEVDPKELIGHYIRCEVTHEQVESTKNPGKMNTYSRLGDKEPADGFDGVSAPAKTVVQADKKPKASSSYNLADLLNN